MRCVVYTEDNYLELGMSAKDAFLKCLPPDSDGKFDVVQVMSKETMDNIDKLTDKDFGMEWQKKFSYIAKFKKTLSKVENGKKFMIVNHFAGIKEFMEATTLLNCGKTIEEVNVWLREKQRQEAEKNKSVEAQQ